MRLRWISFSLIAIVFTSAAKADSVGHREFTALKICISENAGTEIQCYDTAFHVCMAEQVDVAANWNSATERCLFQEVFAWEALQRQQCRIFESVGFQEDNNVQMVRSICEDFGASGPSQIMGDLGLVSSYEDNFLRLRLLAQTARSRSVQLGWAINSLPFTIEGLEPVE